MIHPEGDMYLKAAGKPRASGDDPVEAERVAIEAV